MTGFLARSAFFRNPMKRMQSQECNLPSCVSAFRSYARKTTEHVPLAAPSVSRGQRFSLKNQRGHKLQSRNREQQHNACNSPLVHRRRQRNMKWLKVLAALGLDFAIVANGDGRVQSVSSDLLDVESEHMRTERIHYAGAPIKGIQSLETKLDLNQHLQSDRGADTNDLHQYERRAKSARRVRSQCRDDRDCRNNYYCNRNGKCCRGCRSLKQNAPVDPRRPFRSPLFSDTCKKGYYCDRRTKRCKKGCRGDDDCSGDKFCRDYRCMDKKENGKVCDQDRKCLSGCCYSDRGRSDSGSDRSWSGRHRNLSGEGQQFCAASNKCSKRDFDISDCESYRLDWLVDLAETCEDFDNPNPDFLGRGCRCRSAQRLVDRGEIVCPESGDRSPPACPRRCEVCDVCLELIGC